MISKSIIAIAVLCLYLNIHSVLAGDIEKNSFIVQLIERRLWNAAAPLRLHLGCGQSHLPGYINVDFPASEHTVQKSSGADIYDDITQLCIPQNYVDEIRSHHVFEHFMRQSALALLCQWHQWLKVGGTLVIETPDFGASIVQLQDSRYSYHEKQVIMRHVFGSHEAHWAIHCDGWYKEKFEHVLGFLGFSVKKIEYTTYLNLKNIIVVAEKVKMVPTEELLEKACQLLRESMVSQTDNGETQMWRVWCESINQVKSSIL